METAYLYVKKVGVVRSGTMVHRFISDVRKTPCSKERGEDVNCRKVYESSRDVLRYKQSQMIQAYSVWHKKCHSVSQTKSCPNSTSAHN